jgi:hypothetical protein
VLTIDHLTITVPAGFAARAEHIARLVGTELARLPALPAGDRPSVRCAPITVAAGQDDHTVAVAVAREIHRVVGEGGPR